MRSIRSVIFKCKTNLSSFLAPTNQDVSSKKIDINAHAYGFLWLGQLLLGVAYTIENPNHDYSRPNSQKPLFS